MSDRRNPYLILGLDFGASPEEAAAAFARISRHVKRNSDLAYSLEDVTWALHQIEQSATDHESEVTLYRVPADPGVFASPGNFDPGPQPLRRSTGPSDEAVEALRGEELLELLSSPLDALADLGIALAYEQMPGATGSE